MNKDINLNDTLVEIHGRYVSINDFSTINAEKSIAVYFQNIEDKIIEQIRKYNNVIGCVAWLTNPRILEELAKKEGCVIVVQEEDFLRPDISFDGDKEKWRLKIKKLYDNIKGVIAFNEFGLNMNQNSEDCCDSGVRRLGHLNTEKLPAFPRMHNKFIICYNNIYSIKDIHTEKTPNFVYETNKTNDEMLSRSGVVITGSFNFTENSNKCLENIVIIDDKTIFNAYYNQFGQILLQSVPLDWSGDWVPNKNGLWYGT